VSCWAPSASSASSSSIGIAPKQRIATVS
jgi:hypothetical protein